MEKKPIQADQTHGAEIEKTGEMYEKGGPAPGTRDAGKEGADFQPANDTVSRDDKDK